MGESSDTITFGNILLVVHGDSTLGALKVGGKGFVWRGKSGRVETIQPEDVKAASWIDASSATAMMHLRLEKKDVKFAGFQSQDFDSLDNYLKTKCQMAEGLKKVDRNTHGWNFGESAVEGSSLKYNVDGGQAFDLNLSEVSGCQVVNRNEVALEFHTQETGEKATESLVEMRFQFPAGEDEQAVALKEQITEKASVEVGEQSSIIYFENIPFVVPRGRYNMEMCATYFRLIGKSNTYKIMYSSVMRIFMLPKPDQRNVAFVMTLDPPIRQGQTRYPNLIMQFDKDFGRDRSYTLALTDEQIEQFENKLQKEMEDIATVDLLARVCKVLIQRKITVPGKTLRKSYEESSRPAEDCIKCTFKTNEGFLFPLERSFFFIHKPPLYLRHEEISVVEFNRVGAVGSATASRTFDMTLKLKEKDASYPFTNIDRADYEPLVKFCNKKGLVVVGEIEGSGGETSRAFRQEVEDDDSYLRQAKEEGKEDEEGEDESEEEDDDFKPQEESDVGEEYDSQYNGSDEEMSDSEDDAQNKRKAEDAKGKSPKKAKNRK